MPKDNNKSKKKLLTAIKEKVQTTVFGNLPNGINPEPQYKRTLIGEAVGGRLAVFTFGRMNPPTTGHEKLVDRVKKTAFERGGIPMVYLSHTTDKENNPLNYKQKVRLAKKAFGDVIKVSNAKTIFDVAKELDKDFDRIVMIVGSDRVTEFNRMLRMYNGERYNFNDIHVISAGERDPDSTGVRGMSALLMRNYAAKGNMNMFARGLPKKLVPDHQEIFNMVRTEMLSEDLTTRTIAPGGFIVEPKDDTTDPANNQSRRDPDQRLRLTARSAEDTQRSALGRASGRVMMDQMKRMGPFAMENPNVDVRIADMRKAGSDIDKFRTYYDQELRSLKTKGTTRRSEIG